ncbi:MAG: fibrobacter succinogenes major paralogous domain-containing protein [Prevotellaceae bacterium]|jgi:hypothetical protein|nr:fibrobacter succinogenes major paralogous domain-containing protein [Prevotellaceae bacterium]
MQTVKLLLFPLLFAAMATMPKSAMSQVTIGADRDPQSFSVLELVSNGQMGLRLPQLKENQRNAIQTQIEGSAAATKELAKGLTIYNIDAKCVQYWNGGEWIPAGICGVVVPSIDFPAPVDCTQPVPPVTFMAYNLGADPSLDTPKKQMQYLATHAYDPLDATVYGGFFQWGRGYIEDQALPEQRKVGWKHAVQLDTLPDGTITARKRRLGGLNGAVSRANVIAGNGYDSNGQPKSPNNVLFVTGEYDWSNAAATDIYKLWGNGELVGYIFATPAYGAVPENSETPTKYYQETKWVNPQNNPCPSGFRVPTQDEWERIGAYDCAPNSAGGNFSTSVSGKVPNNNPNLTWVPVACGAISGNCKAEVWAISTRSGYAIYTTADWTANSSYTTDLTNPLAKEPLLFLPAAAFRDSSGDMDVVGRYGYYWSSTVNSAYSLSLNFSSGVFYPKNNDYRAYGFSLRCVAEN